MAIINRKENAMANYTTSETAIEWLDTKTGYDV